MAGLDTGSFNVAVFGPTGAGKSTLVNAVFGKRLAEEGVGAPITQGPTLYRPPGSRIGFYDTAGLEAGPSLPASLEQLHQFIKDTRNRPAEDHIHAAWYCLPYPNHRITQAESTFVEQLRALRIHVIPVVTKVPPSEHHAPELAQFRKAIARELGVRTKEVIPVHATADEWRGDPAEGVGRLLMATRRAAPQAIAQAHQAAQQFDREKMRDRAREVVRAINSEIDARSKCNPWVRMLYGIADAYQVPRKQAREAIDCIDLYTKHQPTIDLLREPLKDISLESLEQLHSISWLKGLIDLALDWDRKERLLRSVGTALGDCWILCCDAAWSPVQGEIPKWGVDAMSREFRANLSGRLHLSEDPSAGEGKTKSGQGGSALPARMRHSHLTSAMGNSRQAR